MGPTLDDMGYDKDKTIDPDEYQIGGDHYHKYTMEPWDIIEEYKLDFWEGNALKYLLRWRQKTITVGEDRSSDLFKCKHYIEKIIKRNEEGKYAR